MGTGYTMFTLHYIIFEIVISQKEKYAMSKYLTRYGITIKIVLKNIYQATHFAVKLNLKGI